MSAWENGSWKTHIKNKQSLLSYGGIYKDDLSTGATKEFNLTICYNSLENNLKKKLTFEGIHYK